MNKFIFLEFILILINKVCTNSGSKEHTICQNEKITQKIDFISFIYKKPFHSLAQTDQRKCTMEDSEDYWFIFLDFRKKQVVDNFKFGLRLPPENGSPNKHDHHNNAQYLMARASFDTANFYMVKFKGFTSDSKKRLTEILNKKGAQTMISNEMAKVIYEQMWDDDFVRNISVTQLRDVFEKDYMIRPTESSGFSGWIPSMVFFPLSFENRYLKASLFDYIIRIDIDYKVKINKDKCKVSLIDVNQITMERSMYKNWKRLATNSHKVENMTIYSLFDDIINLHNNRPGFKEYKKRNPNKEVTNIKLRNRKNKLDQVTEDEIQKPDTKKRTLKNVNKDNEFYDKMLTKDGNNNNKEPIGTENKDSNEILPKIDFNYTKPIEENEPFLFMSPKNDTNTGGLFLFENEEIMGDIFAKKEKKDWGIGIGRESSYNGYVYDPNIIYDEEK